MLKAKSSGKKQSEKSELQNKLFEILDCDLERDHKESQQPDDAIDLKIMSMA